MEALAKLVSSSSVPVGRVERSIDMGRVFANIFHNVDFTASGPSDLANVLAEEPEGGPDALTHWELCSSFDFTVGSEELVSCYHSSRCITIATIVLSVSLNHKVAACDERVFTSISVVFELIVALSDRASLERPFALVDIATIEFITPGENPFGSLGAGETSCEEESECFRYHRLIYYYINSNYFKY